MSKALEDYRQRLEDAKRERAAAGPVHRRDLDRQIKRMQAEIKTYLQYQRQAGRYGGADGGEKS